MKIFFCDNRLGGLLGFRIDIIKHFIDKGHEVCLIVPPALTDWDKVGAKAPKGVRIIEIQMQPSGQNPIKDARLFYQYLKIFRKERPDVVFNYTIKPNIYSSIAAKMCGSRVFCMLAGLGYMFDGKGIIKTLGLKLYQYGLSKAEKVFVLNQMNYDKIISYKMVPADKLLLLPGGEGVNLNDYPYQPADFSNGITFLMISRVLYDKGYQEFVEAAQRIKALHPDTHFEILGPLAYESPMGVPKDIFERDKQKAIFQYLGVAPHTRDFVSRPNIVVVLPSNYGEGLNRSLMEACAIGRPIITTAIPGCQETVESGVNGYLVPPKNTKALVKAIFQFIELPLDAKREMAENSHRIAKERFDINDVLATYDRLLS